MFPSSPGPVTHTGVPGHATTVGLSCVGGDSEFTLRDALTVCGFWTASTASRASLKTSAWADDNCVCVNGRQVFDSHPVMCALAVHSGLQSPHYDAFEHAPVGMAYSAP